MADYVPLKYIRVREGFNVRGVLPNVGALADDIAERGQLEPIAVRKSLVGFVDEVDVLSGHRRYAALCQLCKEKRQAPNPGIRELKSAVEAAKFTSHPEFRRMMLPVDGYFPVMVTFHEVSDRDAKLQNLAENAHKEGMRQVDVYARADELLRDGVEREKIAQALAIKLTVLDRYVKVYRRLNPAIVTRWKEIERPEHEPPWALLEQIGKGGKGRTEKRGANGHYAKVEALVSAPLHEQLAIWTQYYGEDDGRPVRVKSVPRTRVRPLREIRKKRDDLLAASKDPTVLPGAVGKYQHMARALTWALGESEEL